MSINPGEIKGGIIYVKFHKIIDSYDLLNIEGANELSKELKIPQESSAIVDLTKSGDNQQTERLRQALNFEHKVKQKYSVFIILIVKDRRKNPKIKINPLIKFIGNETKNDFNLFFMKGVLQIIKIIKMKIKRL